MPKTLLILCFACTSIMSVWARHSRHPHRENVSGRIIAYETSLSSLACVNGNWYSSIIIRIERPEHAHPEFIQVPFSTPCDKSLDWLPAKSSVEKFRLYRQQDCDSVLEEFAQLADGVPKRTQDLPNWRFLPGTENDKLPFGQVVPCYRSEDLPLEPVL
jgi:hypothetical protein